MLLCGDSAPAGVALTGDAIAFRVRQNAYAGDKKNVSY